MAHRIEVISTIGDPRREGIVRKLRHAGLSVKDVGVVDVYTIGPDLDDDQLDEVAGMLANPVFQEAVIDGPAVSEGFDYAVEKGFLPGVTDNVGNTARESIEDKLRTKFDDQAVYYSTLFLVDGVETSEGISDTISNPLINRVHTKSFERFCDDGGMDTIEPLVRLGEAPKASLVGILEADEMELQRIGKMGIWDHDDKISKERYEELIQAYSEDALRLGDLIEKDGEFFQKVRRGPLALDLTYMHAIRDYFVREGRDPKDIELEKIAQTWSEHCKHTIFADPIDDISEGLFNRFIRGSTERIRELRGEDDICVSVFEDNAGVIKFDDDHYITLKVETHNSPSALDPFGGSITGIVGVNRDPMGTGLGSKPFLNISGPFCFADPDSDVVLYKGKNFTQRMLTARQIHDGVVDGVRVGGNCSGIPTSHFRTVYDSRYRGKPLVHVGTLGVMPVKSAGRESYQKKANSGDLIVMAGGRVGLDGIHGATFSSEALDTGSPVSAVQIGDPITQKKMSDMLIKEARDMGLYTSITDNGAGGLSCSVGEMAKESGGFHVNLESVPLKYHGLSPWQIWISESQERMTLSVPREKWEEFSDLARRRGVEVSVIGEFTDSGRAIVDYEGENVVDLDMGFLHDGLPQRPIKTERKVVKHTEPKSLGLEDLTDSLEEMLSRKNIAGLDYIAEQYDHEVQGGSVLKPLQGPGRVSADATITRPVLSSEKGVVVSQGINPSYSDIDTYHMAASAIDTAIRNAVCAGADPNHLALLDNFCWCSSDDPYRLAQLKDACRACYDYSIAYKSPFVSGKDSMYNDFNGFDEDGNPLKISVPPTLLITAVSVMEDSSKAVSQDVKEEGDLVYVLGTTHDELGGSEYYKMRGEEERGEGYVGNNVPRVNSGVNEEMYGKIHEAINEGLLASAQSVGIGGLAVALAKTCIGGRKGLEADLSNLPTDLDDFEKILYSESQGRVIVTVNPEYKEKFEKLMVGSRFAEIGVVSEGNGFVIKSGERVIVDADVNDLASSYKSTFKDY